MGGTPMMAIAILGWPVDKLGPEVAQQVLEGGRHACKDAGIHLAGGHSIDTQEPIFGLAVSGRVDLCNLKQNSTAQSGDKLFLTKPIGVGVLTTAEKQGKLKPQHSRLAVENMMRLNTIGAILGAVPGVSAMTDVTGFGLLGHLLEMCQGSNLSASIDASAVPVLDAAVTDYIEAGCVPGGSQRNWQSIAQHISTISVESQALLCDPQTSGGLLIAVNPVAADEVSSLLQEAGCYCQSIGTLADYDPSQPTIEVKT
jgi:selenide,water dikinase